MEEITSVPNSLRDQLVKLQSNVSEAPKIDRSEIELARVEAEKLQTQLAAIRSSNEIAIAKVNTSMQTMVSLIQRSPELMAILQVVERGYTGVEILTTETNSQDKLVYDSFFGEWETKKLTSSKVISRVVRFF